MNPFLTQLVCSQSLAGGTLVPSFRHSVSGLYYENPRFQPIVLFADSNLLAYFLTVRHNAQLFFMTDSILR